MSERKVLNKYIPPTFDPSKIPKNVMARDRQYVVRLMTPFSMRCNTCGEYIYKGKKFNARKEDVIGAKYLSIQIYRFYIRCPMCSAEITYKTDPKNADYEIEHGAKRNFEPWREAEEKSEAAKRKRAQEEENNPMKALENKTFDSKKEMDILDALDEIRAIQAAHQKVDKDALLSRVAHTQTPEELAELEQRRREDEEDEALIRQAFARKKKTAPTHTVKLV